VLDFTGKQTNTHTCSDSVDLWQNS